MKLTAPTNWDRDLIAPYRALGIAECYAKLAVDVVGGGRSGSILPKVTRKEVETHVGLLHDAGIEFNYLLNASCLGFREFTRSGDKEICDLLEWLVRIGVDSVTVTAPYLLQMISRRFPSLKLCVSANAEIDSVDRAVFWERLGAHRLTLSHLALNRDFGAIRRIRKAVSCELRLIANTSCLPHCPLARYHTSWDAHSSQNGFAGKAGFAVDYCVLSCKLVRLSDPMQFIRSQWIRPEDIEVYEQFGIDAMKLIDRRCTTEKLIEIATSYSRRRHDGNLFEVLPMFHGASPVSARNIPHKLRYFLHPLETNVPKLRELGDLMKDLEITLDNNRLKGFIDRFVAEDCALKSCAECGHCGEITKDALSFDPAYLEEVRSRHARFLDSFVGGDLFSYRLTSPGASCSPSAS